MIGNYQVWLFCAVAFAATVIFAWMRPDTDSADKAPGNGGIPRRVSRKDIHPPSEETDDGHQSLTKRIQPKEEWLLGKFAKRNYNKDRFSTFLPNGRISPQAMEAANLSESEAIAIQKIINNQHSELEAIVRERMRSITPERADEMATYQIDAFEKTGADTFLGSIEKIEGLIGRLRCELLLSGYDPSDSYFSFGRYDITVSLLRSPGTEQGQTNKNSSLRIITVDPKTNIKHREQRLPLEQFEQRYGKILPLD